MKKNNHIIVFITCASGEEAQKIAESLVIKKLAACVNILPAVKSLFWWEGKIDTAEEILLIVKTKETVFDQLTKTVKKLHSYSVPEIIALPISCGEKNYLDWIDSSI